MARNRNAKGRTVTAPFVGIPHWMLDCPAWRSLSGSAVKVYMAIERHYNGANNGHIGFGARRGEEVCDLNRNTANRALRELETKGFIRCRLKGCQPGVNPGVERTNANRQTEWVLTRHVYNGDVGKDFMRARPEEQGAKRKNAVTKNETARPKNWDSHPLEQTENNGGRPKDWDARAA